MLRGMVSSYMNRDTPLHVYSGHRCPKHNSDPLVGGKPDSAHLSLELNQVIATDVANPIPGDSLDTFDDFARKVGFIRRGKYPRENFLHVDSSLVLPQTQWITK